MNAKDDIVKEGLDAGLKLFQLLEQINESTVNKCLQNTPEHLIELSHRLSDLETKQQQSLYHSASIQKQLETLIATHKLLENAGHANQLLGQQHYDTHIIHPMLRSLFPVLDLIADARRHNKQTPRTADLLETIWSLMEQFLTAYDVHLIEHHPGDTFNPKIMQPIVQTVTSDRQQEGCIAESLQMGFRYGPEHMLRLETVALFSFQPNEPTSPTLIEGELKNVNPRN